MDVSMFNFLAMEPALMMLPPRMDSKLARRMLWAMMFQETRMEHRRQWPRGPARGFWQFEHIAAVEVMTNRKTRNHAEGVLSALVFSPSIYNSKRVHAALEHNDILAVVFARLLLWRLPSPLPRSEQEGYAQYDRAWRPGKKRPQDWAESWSFGVNAVKLTT